jgi:ketosteroid isomerase-like protein
MDAFSVILLILTGVGLTTFLLRLESWPNNRLAGPVPARDTAWAMSEENVELVRAVIDAHERRDFDAVFAAYDPAIEWHTVGGRAPAWSDFEPVYRGHEGVRNFWRSWFTAWETADFEYEEFIDAGDRVVTILSQRMRGRTSGIELEWNSYAQVWTVRNDKVVRVEFLPSRAEALEAVGLSG